MGENKKTGGVAFLVILLSILLVSCSGARNDLTPELEEHYRQSSCQFSSEYLNSSNIDDYSCDAIREMIILHYYVPIERMYYSANCEGEYSWSRTTSTGSNIRLAEQEWKRKYFQECIDLEVEE